MDGFFKFSTMFPEKIAPIDVNKILRHMRSGEQKC